MALPDVDIDALNRNFPCDKRRGYAKACDCRAQQDPDGLDRKLVNCDFYRKNVKGAQCKSCYYQRRYIKI